MHLQSSCLSFWSSCNHRLVPLYPALCLFKTVFDEAQRVPSSILLSLEHFPVVVTVLQGSSSSGEGSGLSVISLIHQVPPQPLDLLSGPVALPFPYPKELASKAFPAVCSFYL